MLELLTCCIYNIGRLSFQCVRVLRYYTVHNHHHICVISSHFLMHSCIGFIVVVMGVDVRSFVVQVCNYICVHLLYQIYVVFALLCRHR